MAKYFVVIFIRADLFLRLVNSVGPKDFGYWLGRLARKRMARIHPDYRKPYEGTGLRKKG